MNLYDENRRKLSELREEVEWSAIAWLDRCFGRGLHFRVAEVARDQERQYFLFAIGRDRMTIEKLYETGGYILPGIWLRLTKEQYDGVIKYVGQVPEGSAVTWTLASNHTRRLACDVYPLNCTYDQIEELALPLGITHPIPWDRPHFEFDKVQKKIPMSIPARIAQLERALERATGAVRTRLLRLYERLKRLL